MASGVEWIQQHPIVTAVVLVGVFAVVVGMIRRPKTMARQQQPNLTRSAAARPAAAPAARSFQSYGPRPEGKYRQGAETKFKWKNEDAAKWAGHRRQR